MVLSKIQCRTLIDLAESKDSWSRIRGGSRTSYSTCTFKIKDLSIYDLLSDYCALNIGVNFNPSKVSIIKYNVGDRIQRHTDLGSDFYSSNKFTGDVVYNVNIRLNEEYSGGEFYLQDKPFIKAVGEIYHYKSDVYHEVKEVLSGVRYIALIGITQSDIDGDKKIKSII